MAEIQSITNPVYSAEDQSSIDCLLKLDTFPDAIPFTASKNDVEPHGVAIYNDLVAGKYGPIGPYVPPKPPAPAETPAAKVA